MRERRVILLDAAELDLIDIAHWVGEFASDAATARYMDRIYRHLAKLAYASERGTIRDEISRDAKDWHTAWRHRGIRRGAG